MNNGIVVLLLIILCVWGVPLWKQFWSDVFVIPDFPDNWPEDQYKHLARELWSEKYEREKGITLSDGRSSELSLLGLGSLRITLTWGR